MPPFECGVTYREKSESMTDKLELEPIIGFELPDAPEEEASVEKQEPAQGTDSELGAPAPADPLPETKISSDPTLDGAPAETFTFKHKKEAETPSENSDGDGSDSNGDKKPKRKKRLGDLLKEQGVITDAQLNVALHEQQKSGMMIGDTLVDLGFILPEVLSSYLADSTGYEEFEPSKTMFDPEALALVPRADANRYQILPISVSEETAVIAMADPYDVVALDKLRQLLPRAVNIIPQVCIPAVLVDAIDNAYGYASTVEGILKELPALVFPCLPTPASLLFQRHPEPPYVSLLQRPPLPASLRLKALHLYPELA